MRIKILEVPQQDPNQMMMKFGGQKNYGLDIGSNYVNPNSESFSPDLFKLSGPLQPVPRELANVELEKNETVSADFNGDGQNEFKDVGGKRHSEGGTPLNLPKDAYIFSDTAKMKIKNPELLKYFGLGGKAKTPADISKKYDVSEFEAILANPDSDKLQRSTAERVIQNFQQKLGALAFVSEAKKGFPTGIPSLTKQAQEQAQESQQMVSGTQVSKYGGKKMQMGGNPGLYTSGIPYKDPGNNPDWNANPWDPTEYEQKTFNPFTDQQFMPKKEEEAPMVNQPGFPDSFPQYAGAPPQSTKYDSTKHPGSVTTDNNAPYPFAFRNQDKAAMTLAAWQLANIHKYPAYIAPVHLTAPQFTLPENTAEKAALASAANTQSMIGALSQEGSHQRSNDSQIWGETIKGIQGSEAKNREQQIGISNLGNEKIAEIMNKQAEFDSNRLSELYKQGIISQQQYDNAIRAGQNNLMKVSEVAADNRQKLDFVNRMNIDSGHYIDPATGRVKFTPAYASASGSQNDFGKKLAQYQKDIIDSNPGIDPTLAWKMADNQLRQERVRRTYNPMNPKQQHVTEMGSAYGVNDDYGTGVAYDPYGG